MQAAYEEMKSVLTDSKLLLKIATHSVIESLRTNPELYNFISYGRLCSLNDKSIAKDILLL